MRSVLPLLLISGCASCVTTQDFSLERECLRLWRCELAWYGRDVNTLNMQRCDDPPGFSADPETKELLGLSGLDCKWMRPAVRAEDEGAN